jgi:hypothetical protein
MKAVLSSLDDLPESLHSEYEQKDGKFHLKLEGDPNGYVRSADLEEANKKLVEFRENNRGLKSKLDSVTAKFEGVDPDEHKKMREKITSLEQQGLKGDADVTSIIQGAIEKAVKPLQQKLEQMSEREKEAKNALARRDLESILTKEGLKAGVSEKAIPDYLRRGLDVFRLKEGEPVAMNGDDTPIFSSAKPSEPLSVPEWIGSLSDDAPHLFKPSAGGGTDARPGGGDGTKTYDPTDEAAFLNNVDGIAKGEIKPRQPTS